MPEPWPEWRSTLPVADPPTHDTVPGTRQEPRAPVEMLARFRRGIAASTVMLKDLTRLGARVEGVGALELDEVVTLALPGCRPALAYVAWGNDHCAGLQFIDPLPIDLFEDLVRQYGLNRPTAAPGSASDQPAGSSVA